MTLWTLVLREERFFPVLVRVESALMVVTRFLGKLETANSAALSPLRTIIVGPHTVPPIHIFLIRT